VLHGSSYLGTAGRLLKKTGAGSITAVIECRAVLSGGVEVEHRFGVLAEA
jgi:hypothetical protein